MIVTFRPLTAWPHPETTRRQPGYRFKASWSDTMYLLEREVRMLDGGNVILGAGFRERDLRLDGLPRSDAREPAHPGIELSFDSKHGRLTYATDAYDRWRSNVRAIALSLEALRAVDRYGVSSRGQQYAGWRQLTAGDGLPSTQEDAFRVLGEVLEIEVTAEMRSDASFLRSLVRDAVKKTHPDTGGDAQAFRKVQRVKELVLS